MGSSVGAVKISEQDGNNINYYPTSNKVKPASTYPVRKEQILSP